MNNTMGPLPTRGLAREELSPARRAVLDTLIDLGGRRTVAELAQELGQHPNTVREHLESLTNAELVARTLRHSTGRGRPAALYRATLAATPAGPEYAVLAEVLVGYMARALPSVLREEHALAAGRDWGRVMRERHLVDGPPQSRLPASGEDDDDASSTPEAEQPAPAGTTKGAAAAASEVVVTAAGSGAELAPAAAEGEPGAWVGAVDRLAEMFERAGFDPETHATPDGGRTQSLRRCPVLALAREHRDIVCTGHLGMAQELLSHEGIAADRVTLEAFAEPGSCLLHIAPPATGGTASTNPDG